MSAVRRLMRWKVNGSDSAFSGDPWKKIDGGYEWSKVGSIENIDDNSVFLCGPIVMALIIFASLLGIASSLGRAYVVKRQLMLFPPS